MRHVLVQYGIAPGEIVKFKLEFDLKYKFLRHILERYVVRTTNARRRRTFAGDEHLSSTNIRRRRTFVAAKIENSQRGRWQQKSEIRGGWDVCFEFGLTPVSNLI